MLSLVELADNKLNCLWEVVERLDARLRQPDVPADTRKVLLASVYILLGLWYNRFSIDTAFTRAIALLESSTYRGILEDGQRE